MKNSDLCPLFCKGKEFDIPENGKLTYESLVLAKENDRSWYFSIVGNTPSNPKVALVGLCPAYTQLTSLIDSYNSGVDFKRAASLSGFKKMRKNIAKMLRKIGIDKKIGVDIHDDFDFNNSPHFFITSLVKCASMKEGKGRSDDYDLLKFQTSRLCLTHRLFSEITNPAYKEMSIVIIFGKKGEDAIKAANINGESIINKLEENGKQVIFLPHPSGSNNGVISQFLKN